MTHVGRSSLGFWAEVYLLGTCVPTGLENELDDLEKRPCPTRLATMAIDCVDIEDSKKLREIVVTYMEEASLRKLF